VSATRSGKPRGSNTVDTTATAIFRRRRYRRTSAAEIVCLALDEPHVVVTVDVN
jgi:hypothetical protein